MMSNQPQTVISLYFLYTLDIFAFLISEDDKIKFLTALDTFTGEEPVMA